MEKKIVLAKRTERLNGCVGITAPAERKLRELSALTGKPLTAVASELILQGAELVEIVESDETPEN